VFPRGSITFALLACLAAVPARAQSPQDQAKPELVFKPAKGFIDDPMAVDGETGRLAVLRTDSASFARLEIVDLASGKVTRSFPAGGPQQLFERILFGGKGGSMVVITRDPGRGRRSAQLFSAAGKASGLIGPFTDFGLTERGGRATLIGWDRRPGPAGGTTYAVSEYGLGSQARLAGPRAYAVSKEGMVAHPELKLLGWQDGYSRMVGQIPGGYDKAKDVRQPDRAAVLDLLSGKVVLDTEISDVMAWATVAQLRGKRPNRDLMVVLNDAQDEAQLVDAFGRTAPLALPAKVGDYDPRSLAEQEEPGGSTLYFSFALDPLNTEALARGKADKPYLDLYRVRHESTPGKSAPATDLAQLLRAPMDDRPVSWVVSGSFLALLRKHKSFSRGGTEVEVYRLPTK
jgi:hypothetical protein